MTEICTSRVDERTTPAELAKYIGDYFEYCMKNDIRPGVEALSLYLGVTRITFFKWSKGVTRKEFQPVAERARQVLAAYMEKVFQDGQINPVAGIFLMKNWYGYADTVTNQIEVKPQRFEDISNEDIANMIED